MSIEDAEEEFRAAIAVYRTLTTHYSGVAERLARENLRLQESERRMKAMADNVARLTLECGALKTKLAELAAKR